eukprot:gene19721-25649_t
MKRQFALFTRCSCVIPCIPPKVGYLCNRMATLFKSRIVVQRERSEREWREYKRIGIEDAINRAYHEAIEYLQSSVGKECYSINEAKRKTTTDFNLIDSIREYWDGSGLQSVFYEWKQWTKDKKHRLHVDIRNEYKSKAQKIETTLVSIDIAQQYINDWEEHIDPFTDQLFWINKTNNKISMSKPGLEHYLPITFQIPDPPKPLPHDVSLESTSSDESDHSSNTKKISISDLKSIAMSGKSFTFGINAVSNDSNDENDYVHNNVDTRSGINSITNTVDEVSFYVDGRKDREQIKSNKVVDKKRQEINQVRSQTYLHQLYRKPKELIKEDEDIATYLSNYKRLQKQKGLISLVSPNDEKLLALAGADINMARVSGEEGLKLRTIIAERAIHIKNKLKDKAIELNIIKPKKKSFYEREIAPLFRSNYIPSSSSNSDNESDEEKEKKKNLYIKKKNDDKAKKKMLNDRIIAASPLNKI